MTKKRSLSALFITLFLVVMAAFMLTACEEIPTTPEEPTEPNYASLVAGTYTFSLLETDGMYNYEFTVDNEGIFALTLIETNGALSRGYSLTGTLTVDENKNVTVLTIDNFLEAMTTGSQTIFGNPIPSVDTLQPMLALQGKVYSSVASQIFKMDFTEDYALISMFDDALIFYAEDAEKLEENTVLKFFTEKDTTNAPSWENIEFLLVDIGTPACATDYYFFLNEFDLTIEFDKTDLLNKLSFTSFAYTIDELGKVKGITPEVVDVTGFDFTTTGTRTGVIKHKVGDVIKEQTVTYTVVETEADHPLYQAWRLEPNDQYMDRIEFLAKGSELYGHGWEISYSLFEKPTHVGYISINEENLVGENAVIETSGYDKTKTGYQTVTFKYRGAEMTVGIFVYDETVNPVISASITGSDTPLISIEYNGEEYTYSLDLGDDLFIELDKADGSTSQVAVTQEMVVDSDLSHYDSGDYIYFAYKYEFDGQTYTFYAGTKVSINIQTIE